MSPLLSYLLVCGRVIRDEYIGGLFTYLDIFEVVLIPKGQTSTVRSFVVVGKLNAAKSGLLNIEVKIIDPDKNEFAKSVIVGPAAMGDTEIAARFDLLTFQKTGRYTLQVTVDGTPLEDGGRYYFEVKNEV